MGMDNRGKKMKKWRKIGKIFKADSQFDWINSHTSMPSTLYIEKNIFRVYFATRCKNQKSRVAYIEVDLDLPSQPLSLSLEPVLNIGKPGFFDDSGVYPGNILMHDDGVLRMYYCGRNNGISPLYYMSIGLAESQDQGKTFTRVFNAPMLGRSEYDPWMVSTPYVIQKELEHHMFYLSGIGWDIKNNKSFYDIKYASSSNGLHWNREGKTILSLREGESNIAAPSIVKWGDNYAMFFSYVGNNRNYKIGMAYSENLIEWNRVEDPAGLALGPDSWDSEAMAYPHVFWHNEKLYLLYSGNSNGRDGLGLAVYE
jgi:predicted GH43/DUF377 family glycosyl hydrolase